MIEENRNYIGGYFDWLCDLINLDESMYDWLIKDLYIIDFRWTMELDINRNRDGLLLREEFAELYPNGIGHRSNTASVLEVLIGLARRMDYVLEDDDKGDRTRIWFWEFIRNLGLGRFTNDYIESTSSVDFCIDDITQICEVWMNRDFKYDGKGSPFPLTTPLENQTHLDMIRQMNSYILERHMYEDELL